MAGIYKPRPGTIINPAHPLSRGLVGCWNIGDGGTKANDSSLTKAHGTLTGFAAGPWAGSHHGGIAPVFDRVDDYIDIGIGPYPFLKTTVFAGFAWIKTYSVTETIMANWDVAVSAGWEFTIGEFSADKISLLQTNSGGSNYFGRYGSTTITDDKWHHVGFSCDGSAAPSGVKLYVDGRLEALTDITSGPGDPGTLVDSGFRIGARQLYSSPNQLYGGSLDCVRLYRGVIPTAAQIAQLYAEPYAGFHEDEFPGFIAAAARPVKMAGYWGGYAGQSGGFGA